MFRFDLKFINVCVRVQLVHARVCTNLDEMFISYLGRQRINLQRLFLRFLPPLEYIKSIPTYTRFCAKTLYYNFLL